MEEKEDKIRTRNGKELTFKYKVYESLSEAAADMPGEERLAALNIEQRRKARNALYASEYARIMRRQRMTTFEKAREALKNDPEFAQSLMAMINKYHEPKTLWAKMQQKIYNLYFRLPNPVWCIIEAIRSHTTRPLVRRLKEARNG